MLLTVAGISHFYITWEISEQFNRKDFELSKSRRDLTVFLIFEIKKDFEKQTWFIQRIQRIIEKREMRSLSLDKPW